MRIQDRGSGIFLTLDLGSGMGKIRIRDERKVRIQAPGKHPESAIRWLSEE
jgi:hypothetical protein